ncbi:MAG: ethanolamine utilization protein EutH [Roseburia inulinivorans]
MNMSMILMIFIAAGAVLGGVDKIIGNRFGLGQKFDDGFLLMGSMALSMTGIICLAPMLSSWLGSVISPIFYAVGIDPAMFGCVLAIDMGGYQFAMDLAQNTEIGRFSGIIASSMFGCTLVFTIPVGMSVLTQEDRPFFLKGLLAGLISLPVGLFVGGLLQGLSFGTLLYQCIPIFLLSAILLLGLTLFPDRIIRLFSGFARLIQIVATVGLILAAVQYITGVTFLSNLGSLDDALKIVGSIAIVMLGSLPLAELLRRCLARPFCWIGSKTGLNDASTTGIIVGTITVMPALAMVRDMDQRGKVLCSSFLVCGASAFAAHMGFAASTQPDLILPLLGGKFAGALLGLVIAMRMTCANSK